MSDGFYQRLESALRCRLFPHTGLHVPQLAGAIGYSGDTVTRWWRGDTRISGEAVGALHEFFASRGDGGFLDEVYGIARRAEAALGQDRLSRELAELKARMARLEATTDGLVAPIPSVALSARDRVADRAGRAAGRPEAAGAVARTAERAGRRVAPR